MSNWFDPNKSFFKLPVVYLTIIITIIVAVVVSFFIYKYSNLYFKINYVGFNNVLEYFRVPISILAMLIPIVAVFAANHRSEQTREQIKISSEQNNFVNYYKHLEEFLKYFKEHTTKDVKFKSHNRLHSVLFPLAKKGKYHIEGSIIIRITSAIDDVYHLLQMLNNEEIRINKENSVAKIKNILLILNDLNELFDVDVATTNVHKGSIGSSIAIEKRVGGLNYIHSDFCRLINELNAIMKFDSGFIGFFNMNKLTKIQKCGISVNYTPVNENYM
ncbi:hypothetical protein [Nitrincola iocasae]|uniref:Uncharacterized protein n=1 Tax=Nitrincola iocasae TaxID=2614693 RepID=A0A5J6LDL8_9GAMM|nr:hypothetical protein [Nitrincola iocasae]QEW06341.1 hypothetical protein F5I99_07390 [Nitrincola iocasae]